MAPDLEDSAREARGVATLQKSAPGAEGSWLTEDLQDKRALKLSDDNDLVFSNAGSERAGVARLEPDHCCGRCVSGATPCVFPK
jgi:hypothetical protein